MSGYLIGLFKKANAALNKSPEKKYIPEILEAAEVGDCDPSKIVWCQDCEAWHEDFHGGA